MLLRADNQPIEARFGDAVWITDFITPDNPDVILKYCELTQGITDQEEIITSLWKYVSSKPYIPYVATKLHAGGRTIKQGDTWLFPAESIQIGVGNCANKSFLLTSLLKNCLKSPGQVYCVVGNLSLDGIGAHAWVEVNDGFRSYIMETTQPNLKFALIPKNLADAYQAEVYFDEKYVYTVDSTVSVKQVLQANFGLCAVDFLNAYLCERCLGLEGV